MPEKKITMFILLLVNYGYKDSGKTKVYPEGHLHLNSKVARQSLATS